MAHQTSGRDSSERFARRLSQLEREVRHLATTPQLSYSSVEGGSLDFNDVHGSPTVIVGALPDGTNGPVVVGGPTPPPLNGVDAVPFAAGIIASWDGTWATVQNVAPLDFARVEIHVSNEGPGFTPDLVGAESKTLQGTIDSTRGGKHAVTGLDHVEQWVKFVPRTLTGKWGTPTGAVGPVLPGKVSADDLEETVLAAGFVLAGAIQVGGLGAANPITISGTEGFIAPQPDGGEVRFPVDGSPARITAHVIAFSLNIKDEFVMSGKGAINGPLTLANTVSPPALPAVVTPEWPYIQTSLASPAEDIGHGGRVQGIVDHHTNPDWLMIAAHSKFGGRSYTAIRPFHRVTGALVTYPDPTSGQSWAVDFEAIGGIARVGSDYILVGIDHVRKGMYTYRISGTTWAKTHERFLSSNLNQFSSRPRIYSTGTQVGIVWKSAGGGLGLSQSPIPGEGGSSIAVTLLNVYPGDDQLGDVYYGDAGTGSARLYVASRLGDNVTTRFVRAFNPADSFARATAHDFVHAQRSQVVGMHYDSVQGRMITLDNTSKLWTYSKFVSDHALEARYTWYDGSDAPYPAGTYVGDVDVSGLPSGFRETTPSPVNSGVLPARSWPVIEMPPPPDEKVTDPAKVDKANRIGLYLGGAATGGVHRLHGYLPNVGGAAQRVVRGVDSFPSSGQPTPPATNGFLSALTNPGSIESASLRLDGKPKNLISGAGPANLDGLIPPGMMMFWPQPTPPPGWLVCDNSVAVSRTGYPDLFAAIGTTFGAGNGTTTFNLPPNHGTIAALAVIKT